ncbi:MAG: NUDIX hydrolase [Bacilli bacterium]|nr:NUDIX hydrolase [Bacilli bacterium]MDD4407355.1 NUDIX hydrolase [Bacilli bacterium]
MNIKYNEGDKINHNSVGAIIRDKEGRILVQDHIKYNFITLPIGKADLNKIQEEELIREVKEETDIDILELHQIMREKKVDIRDGIKVTMHIILFEVTKWTGIVKNMEPHKHKYIKFMSFDEIMTATSNGKNTSWMTQMFIKNRNK